MYQIIIGTPQGELDSKLYEESDFSSSFQTKMHDLYTSDYSYIELADGKTLYLSLDLVKSYYFFVVKAS
jgi:hypothetical protein